MGAVLRFATLDQQSFWLDEAITVELLRDDLPGMLRAIPDSESTPLLYYLLAWPWAKVFGTGEVGLRAFSALCGTATVPVAYAAGAALASRRAGLVAALLVATSPLLVWYSQEARAYALFVLCGALSLWLFARALRRPSRGVLAGWAAASALALASHYFALFLVAVEAAVLLATARRRAVVAATAAVGAVGLALLPLALYQERAGRTSWIDDVPLAERVEDAAREFVAGMYPLPHAAKLGVLLFAAAAALVALRAPPEERRPAVVALAVGALTVALPVALALAGYDYFLTRNVLVAWLPVALFVAIALASDRARRVGTAVAGVLALASVAVVAATASRSDLARDDWRAIADTLETRGRKLVVVAPPYERVPLEYYRPEIRPIGGDRRVAVGEIVLLGYPVEDDAFPPRWFRVPLGFRRAESRLFDRVRLVRFRASRAVGLRPVDLGRASASSAAVLFDRGGR